MGKNNTLKQAKSGETGASKVKLGSYDGTWSATYNGTTFWIISKISYVVAGTGIPLNLQPCGIPAPITLHNILQFYLKAMGF